MTNNNFHKRKNFLDPLEEHKVKITYSPKIPATSIFDLDFLKPELRKSKEKTTICFDMDGTMRGWDPFKFEGFLRDNLKPLLDKLIRRGFRLTVWSATTRDSLQQTINKYPELEKYFDTFIAAENYCFKFLDDTQKEQLKKLDKTYYEMLHDITDPNGKKIDNHSLRPPKNIKLLGYKLLIDDDPNTIKEAAIFDYEYIKLFPYSYENPDIKNDFPEKLSEELEEHFKKNLIDLILSMASKK